MRSVCAVDDWVVVASDGVAELAIVSTDGGLKLLPLLLPLTYFNVVVFVIAVDTIPEGETIESTLY